MSSLTGAPRCHNSNDQAFLDARELLTGSPLVGFSVDPPESVLGALLLHVIPEAWPVVLR